MLFHVIFFDYSTNIPKFGHSKIVIMEYYIIVNNAKQGPYTTEELSRKNITHRTLIWRVGMDDWTEAGEMDELRALLDQMPPETPKQQQQMHFPPKTWLVESILVTCLCCLPLGIIGIVNATKVESYYNNKQYEMAMYYSEQAKRWTLWGFFLTLGFGALYILFIIVVAIAGASL